jgi:hypothetical protein
LLVKKLNFHFGVIESFLNRSRVRLGGCLGGFPIVFMRPFGCSFGSYGKDVTG